MSLGMRISASRGVSRRNALCVDARSAPPKTVRGTTTNRTVRGTSSSRPPSRPPSRTGREAGTTTRRSSSPVPPSGEGRNGSRFYFNFTGFPFPLGPFFERRTVRNEVVRGTIWTFDQTQALDFFDVYTPVRMTVIKLKSGGLWVHAPVAPTDECMRLLRELDAPVEYIVLPTFAYEHKVFVGPFSRKFPKAKVYTTPYLWSFPLNLPPQFFGIFPSGELLDEDTTTPWADEIEQKLLLPPPIGIDQYVRFTEVAFFHKASRSLLVTDAVVYVDDKPPEVIPKKSLLVLAKDGFLARYLAGGRTREEIRAVARDGPAEDTPESLRRGWQRMSLLVLYFNPSDLLTPDESFAAISKKVLVGPVVRTLVYNKIPRTVTDWVDRICADWRFTRIIPCHFNAPVSAGPAEFRAAFQFCYDLLEEKHESSGSSSSSSGSRAAAGGRQSPQLQQLAGPFAGLLSGVGGLFGGGSSGAGVKQRAEPLPPADVKVLEELNTTLVKLGAVYPDAETRPQARRV